MNLCRNFAILLVCCVSLNLKAQSTLQYIEQVRFDKVTYDIAVPLGWQVTNSDFKNAQLQKQNAYILTHIVAYQTKRDSLEMVIKDEINNYKEFASEFFKVTAQKPLMIDNGKSVAVVKHITGGSDAAYQAVAFIPESSWVLIVSLLAETKPEFNQYLPEFEKMIQSYNVNKEYIREVTKHTFY